MIIRPAAEPDIVQAALSGVNSRCCGCGGSGPEISPVPPPSPSVTRSATITPTPTASQTPTSSISRTPNSTPTPTLSATRTPYPTNTPRPTSAPTTNVVLPFLESDWTLDAVPNMTGRGMVWVPSNTEEAIATINSWQGDTNTPDSIEVWCSTTNKWLNISFTGYPMTIPRNLVRGSNFLMQIKAKVGVRASTADSKILYIEPSVSATPSTTVTPSLTRSVAITHSVTPTPGVSQTRTPVASLTPTRSATPSGSAGATPSPTSSASPTITPTVSNSTTPGVTPSNTPTITASVSPSLSATPSVTATITPTISNSATPPATPDASQSATPTVTPTNSTTPSVTVSTTPSLSATPSVTAGATPSPTASVTPTITPTISNSGTPGVTPSNTPTGTPAVTPTNSATPSVTASVTPTISNSATPAETPGPSATVTPSVTASNSGTPAVTPSTTPSLSATPSVTADVTPSPTASVTPTITPTISNSGTPEGTPPVTPSPTAEVTPTNTPTASVSATPESTPPVTPSPTAEVTPTNTPTASVSATPEGTPPVTPSPTAEVTPTNTPTASVSATPESTPPVTPSPTAEVTPTNTPTASVSATPEGTPPVTPSPTAEVTPTNTPTASVSATPESTPSPTASVTPTITPTVSNSATPEGTPPVTPSPTAEVTPTNTPTSSVTPTITPTPSVTIVPPFLDSDWTFSFDVSDVVVKAQIDVNMWQGTLTPKPDQILWQTVAQGGDLLWRVLADFEADPELEWPRHMTLGGVGLEPGQTFLYRIKAVVNGVESVYSEKGGIVPPYISPTPTPTPTPSVTPSGIPDVIINVNQVGENKAVLSSEYSVDLTASGGDGTYNYSVISGTLPDGIVLDSTSGTVSGTPTTSGTFNLEFQVISGGKSDSRSVILYVYESALQMWFTGSRGVISIESMPLTTFINVEGGIAPYTVEAPTITAENYPDLTFNPSINPSTISGNINTIGDYTIPVTVTDSVGTSITTNLTYQIITNGGDTEVVLNTDEVKNTKGVLNIPYNAGLTATGGSGSYEYSVWSGALPTGLTLSSSTGLIDGTPTISGSFEVGLRVDSNNTFDPELVTIYVYEEALNMMFVGVTDITIDTPIEVTVTPIGGIAPYTFAAPIVTIENYPELVFELGQEGDQPYFHGYIRGQGTHVIPVTITDSVGGTYTEEVVFNVTGATSNIVTNDGISVTHNNQVITNGE